MKKIFFTIVAGLLLFTHHAFTQERLESLKVGFITQKLNLTTEEAKVFWPVYNKYNDELDKLRKSTRGKLMGEFTELPDMSDVEADKLLNEMISFKVAEIEIIKKYSVEFKKVLPVKKVVLLFKTENDFKRELLRRFKERKRDDR